MRTKESLIAARALIEKGWTQGVYAKSKNGGRRLPHEEDAVEFCAIGALGRVLWPHDPFTYNKAYWLLAEAMDGTPIGFNDKPGRTKEEVLAAFDAAIERAND